MTRRSNQKTEDGRQLSEELFEKNSDICRLSSRHPERGRAAKRKRSVRSEKESESKDLGIAMKMPQKAVPRHCERKSMGL